MTRDFTSFSTVFGLNVFISILLQHVSHITTCKFLGLERKHIAYLVLLLAYINLHV